MRGTCRSFLRVPPFQSGPTTTIQEYAAWREELRSFQLEHYLSDIDLVCMVLEQSAILGGLIETLLEDLRVDDVLRPMITNLNGDMVANQLAL